MELLHHIHPLFAACSNPEHPAKTIKSDIEIDFPFEFSLKAFESLTPIW